MTKGCKCIIGVDFDNTLVSYDDLFKTIASERGLIPVGMVKSKKTIRDHIRRLGDGDIEWQKLQAVVYGPRISEARLVEGVQSFFRLCRQAGMSVYIISHKTEFAGYDETRTNLRKTALDWMTKHHFFESQGLGLVRESVFFGDTRRAKVDFIRQLGCTHFIDDLEETFLEDYFPPDVEKILYVPCCQSMPAGVGRNSEGHQKTFAQAPGEMKIMTSWSEISKYFFTR